MNSCETCRHWDRNDNRHAFDNADVHECTGIKMYNHHNNDNYDDPFDNTYDTTKPVEYVYQRKEDYQIIVEQHMRARAYVEDASSYYARLVTRSDFGCVIWEKIDD